MILSMTGFGKAIAEVNNKKLTVEIKSLNSKQLDLSMRISGIYKEKEMDIRSVISRYLERGKVDVSIYTESIGKDSVNQIDVDNFDAYKKQVERVAEVLKIEQPADWFSLLIRLPEVIKSETPSEISEDEQEVLMKTVTEAVSALTDFRIQEGRMLESLFRDKVANISSLLLDIEPYEEERVERVYQRIKDALLKKSEIDYDKNRLEQEMIYYIEKLDVNEEKSRLRNHLNYFLETLDGEKGQGKKLGFILQEIGREINTLGSKSNHFQMQKLVVQMKDELEQMKEQVLNVM